MSSEKPELEQLIEAYREAKAKHDAALAAVRQATTGRQRPDPELVRRQGQAAMEEFKALAALRAAARE